MDIELEGTPYEVINLLYGGEAPDDPPKFNTILSFKRAGKAGISGTQRILRKKSPKQMPKWYWEMVENRPSWKNATEHQAHFHSVSLVTNPLPELEFGRGIPEPMMVSVGFTTEEVFD